MNTVYICFRSQDAFHYRIVNTELNPNTWGGLENLIIAVEKEVGAPIIPIYWKGLET